MSFQDQFLTVIDRDEAEARFHAALTLEPLGSEWIPLAETLGRVLAQDVLASVDVPSFDRSNFDGFAVKAQDTFGASELFPKSIRLLSGTLDAGTVPSSTVESGTAMAIATGGMLPRGADAVLMVEHAEVVERSLVVRRAVTPGFGVSFAGTDIARGETVLRAGTILTSRETGVLAAIGENRVCVWRKPRVAILSTGNELLAPGEVMQSAHVYDSNAQTLADAVRELGGEPHLGGIIRDDVSALRQALRAALADSDVVLLSGGTSKGKGDLCYRVVSELQDPGIVAHGVALKPGKPLCLAATQGKPVVVLPGFPASALFTFQEFVAPVIRRLAGRPVEEGERVTASLAVKTNSEIGRTEYLLVSLIDTDTGYTAFPLGKGSGSVTTFSQADGFITIPRQTEIIEAGATVEVRLIGRGRKPVNLVVMGSHCLGLDWLLSELQRRGITAKFLAVGSSAGLLAAKRGECDLAGIHLLDAETGVYNRPFLSHEVEWIAGYGRLQGIVFRRDDARFAGRTLEQIATLVVGRGSPDTSHDGISETPSHPSELVMVNRNQGSGTRILIDRLLAGAKPPGYAVQPTNHTAVAAAVAQGRADWGVAIESAAKAYDLGFIPYQEERYDFVVPRSRRHRSAVEAFVGMLTEPKIRRKLCDMGFRIDP